MSSIVFQKTILVTQTNDYFLGGEAGGLGL